MFIAIYAVLFSLAVEAVLGVTLEQKDLSMTKGEGKTIHISCKVTGLSSSNYVHWYQKKDGEALTRILYVKSGSNPVRDNNHRDAKDFSVRIQSNNYDLKIANLKKSHSAVYYCASWEKTFRDNEGDKARNVRSRGFNRQNDKAASFGAADRFRESGTISVRKGQGRKTILDARDLRALRRHCITYRNATVMEITTWAQEYFQKTLSVNTIHRAIRGCRLKLYRSKKKPYLNMIQKRRRFLWAKAHLKWTVAKWKTVLWSDESKFEVLFGKLGRHVIQTKAYKDNPSCYQRSVQKPASLMVWGCMSACGMGSLHIWKGTNQC
ncbi:hypothetical protein QTP70_006943 [Hemibagrus guttatus]|uniref:Ig-like domain-containing protein n=1 Tax=Hemibagrus guttatus TaxID=175788 RepID=A0AAE0R6B2_9TELE|nr:hypothetical protein QTP70_006943 [Hemibagrus guttatus]